MTQSEGVLSFSAEVVNSLPLFYRAMVERLVVVGRATIKDENSEKPSEKEQN